MFRFLFICLCLFLSHSAWAANGYQTAFDSLDAKRWSKAQNAAATTGDRKIESFVQWKYLQSPSNRPAAEEILKFIDRHPYWPEMGTLLRRAGEALMLQGMHSNAVDKWYRLAKKHELPTTSDSAKKQLLHRYWREGTFSKAEQNKVISAFASQLSAQDYYDRVDALLWKKKTSMTYPLHSKMPAAKHKLINARIALMTNQRDVNTAINAVPKSLRDDPALQYERLRWRARKKQESGVKEILYGAPDVVPHPKKWWKYRVRYVRNAIEAGQYKTAMRLLKNHGQVSGASFADAMWLRGWVYLHFLNKPKEAYKDFYQLYHKVSYPISLTRGAYWAGVAANANQNLGIAQNWFKIAAQHSTSFYGQLAHLEMQPAVSLNIQATRSKHKNGTIRHMDNTLKGVIKLLDKYNQKATLRKFLHHTAKQQKTPEGFTALGYFAKSLGHPELMVQIGKKASQLQHYWLQPISHPKRSVPHRAIEAALALAITRQESEFNPKARSHANARGMMQLLPGTAKQVAREQGIPYSSRKLEEANYNMTLGIHYLAGLVKRYDGSYPLAIAAYNAGPGNVNKWIKRFGKPKPGLQEHLKWIERIPFSETRNYVQRVLENLQTYRQLLGENKRFSEARALGAGR